MRFIGLLIAALLVTALSAACRQATFAAAAEAPGVPAGCAACHQGQRSFAGRDADELAAAMRKIRDGVLRHPALGLKDDSDAAIAALAEELVKH